MAQGSGKFTLITNVSKESGSSRLYQLRNATGGVCDYRSRGRTCLSHCLRSIVEKRWDADDVTCRIRLCETMIVPQLTSEDDAS